MNGVIFFFSSLGVFNGLLLSFYLFLFAKQKSLAKYLLGALVLALSIRIGKSILLYFNSELPKIYLQIGLSACLFIGPLLYFYLKAVLEETKKMPKTWKYTLLSLLALIVIVGAIKPYQKDPLFWNNYVVHTIYCVWFIGVCAAGFILIPHVLKSCKKNKSISSLQKWLSAIYLGNVIIASAFFLAIFGNSMAYYISGPIVFSFFLYLIVFGYFNDQWFDISNKQASAKYQNKKIESKEATELLRRLDQIMIEDKVYIKQDLKLKELADKLEIPAHQLSQLLNDNLGKSFKYYINELRINEACELLGTKHQLSLEGIGYEVGFRSKSTFFTTFKKFKNQTPAQYQSEISLKTT